jgi:hypothetical protein
MDINKFVGHSQKIQYEDLDWELARQVGLTDSEKEILTYFADVEGQTVFYMRELLNTNASKDPDAVTFLTLWNYEEFFHSFALMKLLDVCGAPLDDSRLTQVRTSAKFAAKAEEFVQTLISRILPSTFTTLYMAWGASQELLTLRGYEQIAQTTPNPVLRELCLRIAMQERRHFAWYFNSARERLAESRFEQRFIRGLFDRFWTPVGVGVKSRQEIASVISGLFPGESLEITMTRNDAKLATLPGMRGFDACSKFASSIQPLLPAADPVLAAAG